MHQAISTTTDTHRRAMHASPTARKSPPPHSMRPTHRKRPALHASLSASPPPSREGTPPPPRLTGAASPTPMDHGGGFSDSASTSPMGSPTKHVSRKTAPAVHDTDDDFYHLRDTGATAAPTPVAPPWAEERKRLLHELVTRDRLLQQLYYALISGDLETLGLQYYFRDQAVQRADTDQCGPRLPRCLSCALRFANSVATPSCGHVCMCHECAMFLYKSSGSSPSCPVCRMPMTAAPSALKV